MDDLDRIDVHVEEDDEQSLRNKVKRGVIGKCNDCFKTIFGLKGMVTRCNASNIAPHAGILRNDAIYGKKTSAVVLAVHAMLETI